MGFSQKNRTFTEVTPKDSFIPGLQDTATMQCLESIQPQSGRGVWTEPLKQHHGHFANLSDELVTKQAFVPQKT